MSSSLPCYAAAPAFLRTTRLLFCCLSVGSIGLAGCGQSDKTGSGLGGATAQAGARADSGGASGSGDHAASGAQSAGQTGNGGTPASGGGNGLGGDTGSGGLATATGGANSAGGAGNGGTTGKGGSTSSGGALGTGGATSVDATIVPDPSWTCGMPDGIPAPSSGTLVFSASLTISATHNVGNTQYGKRRQLDVSGGTITGDKLKGTVLSGGLDYELTLSTGAMELEEVLVYKTSDNTSIFVRNCGVAAAGDPVVRVVPDIEAPTSGSYAWLNTSKLVGTRVVAGDKITLDIY